LNITRKYYYYCW